MTDRKENSRRYYQNHIESERKRRYNYYLKNKEGWAKYHLNKYGITLSEYQVLLDSQKGVCKICEKKCESGKILCVDHNHDTGQIRGLLCTKCNKGLGLFKDNYELLKRAAKYLK